ncbi:MAG: transcription antitermination factor NusB [Pirellula sp.]|jgi:N utilization substance protein B|nr:transcription antitermination factor NusB [Pirellula sp.]
MTTRRRAREIALQVLYEEDLNPLREYEIADEFVERRMLNNKPLVAFAKNLVHGVRENKTEIDQQLSKYAANWSVKRMTTIDRNILRISAFEMIFGDTPGRVSINEAIELAKRYGSRSSSQFVNGILDRILKDLKTEAVAVAAGNPPEPQSSETETDEEISSAS